MSRLSLLLLVGCSDFELRDLTAPFNAEPDIAVEPAQIRFASAEPISEVVTITNVGDAALTVEAPLIDSELHGRFSVLTDGFPVTLETDESVEAVVTFEAAGDESEATLQIPSTDPDTPVAAVELTGVVEVPILQIDPESHDFGTIGLGCDARRTFTLKNIGTSTLTLDSATLDSDVFTLRDPLSVETLTPGAHTTLSVRFAPEADGEESALLIVESDDPYGTRYATITGAGEEGLPCEETIPDDCDDGYWADYYNLTLDHPDMEDTSADHTGTLPWHHDWFDETYFFMRELEPQLTFGSNWYPVDDGQPGDPYHFTVHIVAKLEVEEDMTATFEMGSDDDSWAFINGELEGDLSGLHGLEITTFDVPLTAGVHDLELYMAERHTSESAFWFKWLVPGISVFACPEEDE